MGSRCLPKHQLDSDGEVVMSKDAGISDRARETNRSESFNSNWLNNLSLTKERRHSDTAKPVAKRVREQRRHSCPAGRENTEVAEAASGRGWDGVPRFEGSKDVKQAKYKSACTDVMADVLNQLGVNGSMPDIDEEEEEVTIRSLECIPGESSGWHFLSDAPGEGSVLWTLRNCSPKSCDDASLSGPLPATQHDDGCGSPCSTAISVSA